MTPFDGFYDPPKHWIDADLSSQPVLVLCQSHHDETINAALTRVADFLLAAWLQYARETNCLNIIAVASLSNKITFFQGPYEEPGGTPPRQFGLMMPFPDNIKDADKAPLLSYEQCEVSGFVLARIAERLFRCVCSEAQVEEYECEIPHSPRPVAPAQARRSDVPMHRLMKITTHNAQSFALDLTGSQYGFREHFLPWAEFELDRQAAGGGVYPIGHTEQLLETVLRKSDVRQGYFAHQVYSDFFRRALHDVLHNEHGVRNIFHLPQGRYGLARDSLLREAVRRLKAFIAQMNTDMETSRTSESRKAWNPRSDMNELKMLIVRRNLMGRRQTPVDEWVLKHFHAYSMLKGFTVSRSDLNLFRSI